MRLCHKPSDVLGAEPCPRRHGHRGPCFWTLVFAVGETWHAVVYSGQPQQRVRRARGRFTQEPSIDDVAQLLETIGDLRQREIDRRERRRRLSQAMVDDPYSEPVPWSAPTGEPPAMVVEHKPPEPQPRGTVSERAARMAAHRARQAQSLRS